MPKISSKTNPKIKLLKKLGQKKYRTEHGLFIIENFVSIYDAFLAGHYPIEIYIDKNFYQKNISQVDEIIKKSQAELFLINETVNKHFSNLDTPSGITALYRIKTKDLNNTKPIIYLNSINDPGNLGTIIRSMLAFGFDNLVMDEHCADPYNPKTISSAKNSIFEINTFKDKNFEFLQSTKLPIYVSLPGKGEDIKSFQPESNYILIIGSESHGADKDIIELAKKKINIKINKQIESLNASVATSIMLYELSNKQ